jgi:drug/metabolite transporter (DMT)-like permease
MSRYLGAVMVAGLLLAIIGGIVLCLTGGQGADVVLCLLPALSLVLGCAFVRGARDRSEG